MPKKLTQENIKKELFDNMVLKNATRMITSSNKTDVLSNEYVNELRTMALAIVIKCDDYLMN